MKQVWKFATGVDIPEGAVYLCTKVEKEIERSERKDQYGHMSEWHHNKLVWHYFLVEMSETEKEVCQECGGKPNVEWSGMYFCGDCWNKKPDEKPKDTEHSMHCCCPTRISPPRK
jgi:hypothetical protein